MVGSGRRRHCRLDIKIRNRPFVLIIDANDFSRPLPILALIILSDLADFLPLLHRQNYVVGHNMTSPSTSQSYNLQFVCLFERVDGYNEVK